MEIKNVKNNRKCQTNKKAIAYMIFSVFCFALMAAIVKILKNYPLMEIIAFRSLPTWIIASIILKKKNISIYGNDKKLLLLRAFLGFLANIGFFYTFKVMLLTDAMTLRQLGPFFIIVLAWIFLKEEIYSHQLLFLLLAFFGAILVIKPGLNLDYVPGFIAIFAAFVSAGAHVIVRRLRKTDYPLVIINYLASFSTVMAILYLLVTKQYLCPTLIDIIWFMTLGVLGFFAQFGLTIAYKYAPAGLISLYMYLMIVFGVLFDLLFFGLFPDYFSTLGAILVLLSGYLNYRWGEKIKK